MLDGMADWYRKYRNTARVPARQPGRLRPERAPPRRRASAELRAIDRYLLDRLDALIARVRDGLRQVRAARGAPRAGRVRVDRSVGAVRRRGQGPPVLRRADLAGPARRAGCAVRELARADHAVSADPGVHRRGHLGHLPKRAGDPDSVHLATFASVAGTMPDEALAADLEIALAYRELVTKALEAFRAAKHKSTDARITLAVPAADRAALTRLAPELADLFIVAEVVLAAGDAAARAAEVAEVERPRCERCWKRVPLAAEPADVCVRCAAALGPISG
jgi:isoleucyl-tRNA synthetase